MPKLPPHPPRMGAQSNGPASMARGSAQGYGRGRPAAEASALQSVLRSLLPSPLPTAVLWGRQERIYYNRAFEALSGIALVEFGAVLPKGGLVRSWFQKGPTEQIIVTPPEPIEDTPSQYWAAKLWSINDDTISGQVLMLTSQSRRIVAEQALRASEEMLSTLTEQTSSLLWRCDLHGQPVWMNHRAQETAAFVDGTTAQWDRFLDAPSRSVLMASFKARAEERRAFALHLPLTAHGADRWHRLYFNPLFDTDGALSSWAGSGVDVDAWHIAWKAHHLVDANAYGTALGDDDLIWQMDAEAKSLTALDRRHQPDWGLPIEGHPVSWNEWCALIRPEDRELALAIPERVLQGEAVQITLALAEPVPGRQALCIHAFLVRPFGDGTETIGGVFRPAAHAMAQRVYWVGLSDEGTEAFEVQRARLFRDQIRLLHFDDVETFLAVSKRLEPGAVVFAAPTNPEALSAVLEALDLVERQIPWLVTNTHNYPLEAIVGLMRKGALDVLSSSTGPRLVSEAIKLAVAKVHHDEVVLEQAQGRGDVSHRLSALTKREKQVLEGLLAGGTNKSIAMALKLSPRTVESHRAHLMDRIGAKSLADLLRLVSPYGSDLGPDFKE